MQRRALMVSGLLVLAASPARADGLDALARFLKGVSGGQSNFTQVVTAPTRNGQPGRVRTSKGSFAFARPSRFRFVYDKPFEQTIVADGKTLWMFDVDLNQVTARKQAEVLGSTPAALISAAADLTAIKAEYTLQAQPDADGLQWVLAVPKARDGQLQSVRIGLRGDTATPSLAVLDILDNFGQRSELRFDNFDVNPSLPESTFQFKPPAGADVLRQ
ncbi:MAG: outer membrane lipoprotein chaperone LolA [Burkholderiaceae bacterium]